MSIYLVMPEGKELVAGDPTANMVPYRFAYAAGGWAAKVAFVPKAGESYLLLGNDTSIVAATGYPTTALEGPHPLAWANVNATAAAALHGAPIAAALPLDTALVEADIGKIVKWSTGQIVLATAASDVVAGILRTVPDPATDGHLGEVVLCGPCKIKGINGGVTAGDRLTMAANAVTEIAATTDFVTSQNSGAQALGSRAIAMALETAASGVDFMGYFVGVGSLAFVA